MRWGIVPRFDLAEPVDSQEDEAAWNKPCVDRILECFNYNKSDDEASSSEEERPELKGRKCHLKTISDAEKLLKPIVNVVDDDDYPSNHGKSWFDAFIVHTASEKRSTLLDVWRIYIALLSIVSALLGLYMGAF